MMRRNPVSSFDYYYYCKDTSIIEQQTRRVQGPCAVPWRRPDSTPRQRVRWPRQRPLHPCHEDAGYRLLFAGHSTPTHTQTGLLQLTDIQTAGGTIRIYLLFPETRNVGLHFTADSMAVNLVGSVTRFFSAARVRFGRSRSSKVIDFGTNRKRTCDFLLVRHSNPGPVLHRFGDIAGFLCSWVFPPLLHPNFGGVPVAPDRPCWGQPEQRP